MDISNAARVAVIAFGGAVVGVGFAVLRERARHYSRLRLPHAVAAMGMLAVMNASVLAYIAAVLVIDRWNESLSWRWWAAVFIFASKSVFFYLLALAGVEQDRRELFDDHPPG